MRIAVLEANHWSQYKDLMLHAYEHAADAFTSTPEERRRETDEWWIKRVADPFGLTVSFGAFDGTAMVGTVALEFSAKPKTLHKALVIGMYVLPSHRGHWLARALLLAAIGHCRERATVSVVQLEVTHGNEPASAMYRSLGFQQFGLEPLAVLTPGGYRAKEHMWLHLAVAKNEA